MTSRDMSLERKKIQKEESNGILTVNENNQMEESDLSHAEEFTFQVMKIQAL